MPTGRLATNRESVGPELFLPVPHQPNSSFLAIVRPRWVGMFWCQAVFDGDNRLLNEAHYASVTDANNQTNAVSSLINQYDENGNTIWEQDGDNHDGGGDHGGD